MRHPSGNNTTPTHSHRDLFLYSNNGITSGFLTGLGSVTYDTGGGVVGAMASW